MQKSEFTSPYTESKKRLNTAAQSHKLKLIRNTKQKDLNSSEGLISIHYFIFL